MLKNCFLQRVYYFEVEKDQVHPSDMRLLNFVLISLILGKITHDVNAMSGGRDAPPGKFPYMAALLVNKCFYCGGAIISARHVLTATHCVECNTANQMQVAVGIVNYLNPARQIRAVEYVTKHPNDEKKEGGSHLLRMLRRATRCKSFLSALANNYGPWDIAILTLKDPLDLGTNVQIRPRAPANYNYKSGTACEFAGWGATVGADGNLAAVVDLQWTDVLIEEPTKCEDAGLTLQTDQGEFCTSSSPGTLRSGDSGGPLVCNNIVVGVISRGDSEDPLQVFGKVADSSAFIDKVIRDTYRKP